MPTFDTPEPITLRVKNTAGNVRIEASDRTDTEVEVLPGNSSRRDDVEAAEQTRVHHSNGTVVVETPEGRERRWFGGNGPEVRIRVGLPTGSTVRIDAASADVETRGRLADGEIHTASGDVDIEYVASLEVKTASGDVNVQESTGDANISTASGDIRVPRVSGSARAAAASGDIALGQIGRDVEATTASGDVQIQSIGGSVKANTASGDVVIKSVTRGQVSVNTASGDVVVGVASGTAAWLELNSLSGDVRSALDSTDEPGTGETVEIRAGSLSGDIQITRAH